MSKFNLSSNQSDRINFDQTVHNFAYESAQYADENELSQEVITEYWNQFSDNLDTDDLEEAEARFINNFSQGWNSYFEK